MRITIHYEEQHATSEQLCGPRRRDDYKRGVASWLQVESWEGGLRAQVKLQIRKFPSEVHRHQFKFFPCCICFVLIEENVSIGIQC